MEQLRDKTNRLNIIEVAEGLGLKFKSKGHELYTDCFVCGDSKQHMKVSRDNTRLLCMKCRAVRDSVQLYSHYTGKDTATSINKLLNGRISSCSTNKTHAKITEEHQLQQYEDKLQDIELLEDLRHDPQYKNKLIAYMLNRGLNPGQSIKTLRNNFIVGFDKAFKNICLIDNNRDYILSIGYSKKPGEQSKNPKYNFGRPHYTKLIIDSSSKTFIICEGIEDSLTATELGYNSICLNSCSNAQELLKRLTALPGSIKDYTFIIGTDNDPKGRETKDLLQRGLMEHCQVGTLENIFQAQEGEDLNSLYKNKLINRENIIINYNNAN